MLILFCAHSFPVCGFTNCLQSDYLVIFGNSRILTFVQITKEDVGVKWETWKKVYFFLNVHKRKVSQDAAWVCALKAKFFIGSLLKTPSNVIIIFCVYYKQRSTKKIHWDHGIRNTLISFVTCCSSFISHAEGRWKNIDGTHTKKSFNSQYGFFCIKY